MVWYQRQKKPSCLNPLHYIRQNYPIPDNRHCHSDYYFYFSHLIYNVNFRSNIPILIKCLHNSKVGSQNRSRGNFKLIVTITFLGKYPIQIAKIDMHFSIFYQDKNSFYHNFTYNDSNCASKIKQPQLFFVFFMSIWGVLGKLS